jgi:imidazolonepropionase-like amidohydrolase
MPLAEEGLTIMSVCATVRVFSLLAGAIIASPAPAKSLAIVDALVYLSATAAPLPHASVLMQAGRIVAVGERIQIPPDAEVIRCSGCAVMAGFWNCHIHFTEPKWENAAAQPAQKLVEQLQSMLLRSGFTTVVDTASMLANTGALRRRIESGEIPGPRILTAGVPIYPPDGVPYYVKESLPPAILAQIIPPRNPKEAAAAAELNIQNGADIIKLFTGSWISHGTVLPMPEPIARAAVTAAHEHHRLVFAHPSNLAGIQVAIASGVDVLAHAPDDTRDVNDTVLRQALANHMAMIPTLKLFSGATNIADIRRIVRRFHDLGGELMFGTDTGYLTDYDVGEEFQQLGKMGLDTVEILRMLTENPARRFGLQAERGRIAPGMIADVTILESDPAVDLAAFSHVRCVIRGGGVIYNSH